MSQDRQHSFHSLMDVAKSERSAYLAQLFRLFASHLARLPTSLSSRLRQVIGTVRLASYVARRH